MELSKEQILKNINNANEFSNSLKVVVTNVTSKNFLNEINIYGFLHKDPKYFKKSSLYKVLSILKNDFGMKWGSNDDLLDCTYMINAILDYREDNKCIVKITINASMYLNRSKGCISWGSNTFFLQNIINNDAKIKLHARELIKNPDILNHMLNQIESEFQKQFNKQKVVKK